ncbi:MAG: hypothetical protein GY746_17290 [Gammaproteobacteria bacterium]|nr:hypothetical protein [Gammaproteobacteria bacterium]
MSYRLPDPRFEMPELFEPGVKPVGAVEIDWDKLKNVINFYYPAQRSNAEDLRGAKDLTINGAIYTNNALNFDGINDYINATNLATVASSHGFFAYVNVSTTDARIFDSASSSRKIIARNSSTGNIRMYQTNSWKESSLNFPLNEDVLVGYMAVPGDGTHVFVNDKTEKVTTTQSGITNTTAIFSYNTGASSNCAGRLYYYGITYPDLDLLKMLTDDPYQFLIPA